MQSEAYCELLAEFVDVESERDHYKQTLEEILDMVLRTDTDVGKIGQMAKDAVDNIKPH